MDNNNNNCCNDVQLAVRTYKENIKTGIQSCKLNKVLFKTSGSSKLESMIGSQPTGITGGCAIKNDMKRVLRVNCSPARFSH